MQTAHARTGGASTRGFRPRVSQARVVGGRPRGALRVTPHEWEIGTYRFVIRAVLWCIYLAVVLAVIIWWVRT